MNRWLMVALFLVTLFRSDRIGGALLENVLYRSPQRYSMLYEGRYRGEVVAIGNSRGVHVLDGALIEERAGTSVTNIGHNAMTPTVIRAIFNDYLEHNPPPKLLIVEASCVTSKTGRGLLLDYKPFWRRSARLRQLGESYSPNTATACQLSHLYRYNSEMYLRALSYWLRGRSDQQSFMYQRVTPSFIAAVEQMKPREFRIVPAELEALRGLIEDATEAGVNVKLIYSPVLPAYAERVTNLEQFLSDVSQATGREVQDYSGAITDASEFADRFHINRDGSRHITEIMIERGLFN